MDRRNFLLILLATTLAAPVVWTAQSSSRVYRVGFVGLRPAPVGRRNASEMILVATLRDLDE